MRGAADAGSWAHQESALFRSVPVETRTAGWTGERAIKSVRGGRVEEDVKSKSAFLRGLSRELCYRNTGLIF